MSEVARPKKLADQAYERILTQVMSGRFPEGERLPSEAELSTSLNVSRPILREALSRLRSDGIVVSRHGSGTYVQRRPNKALFDIAPTGSIAGMMRAFEFRVALEGEAAALAAIRRTSRDLTLLGRAFNNLEKAIRKGEIGVEADINFHLAIAAASKNDLFHSAMQMLSPQISKGITAARRLSMKMSGERLRRVQLEHKAILTNISESNPEGARAAMHAHLNNARTRLLTENRDG